MGHDLQAAGLVWVMGLMARELAHRRGIAVATLGRVLADVACGW